MTLKLARRTHTKILLGTGLPLSHEYSYIHKIMLISKYFCKDEYLNIDILYIKQTFLTQICKKKKIFFTYISSRNKICVKINLTLQLFIGLNIKSLLFSPRCLPFDCVPRSLFVSVRFLRKTSSFEALVLSGRAVLDD